MFVTSIARHVGRKVRSNFMGNRSQSPAYVGWVTWLRAMFVGAVLVGPGCGDNLPTSVSELNLEAPLDYHRTHGFIQMVPATHLPSSSNVVDQTEIWVKVPEGATITSRLDPKGRAWLEFPEGTVADRVEFALLGSERRVTDIRGATIEAGRQRFHVLRPSEARPDAPLFGVQWTRADSVGHRAATERLLERLSRTPEAAAMLPKQRTAMLESVRSKNNCLPCHARGRPDNATLGEHGVVNRGTDYSGFFTPTTVLRDTNPLESYGRFDRSLADPAVTIKCDGKTVRSDSLVKRRCANKHVAVGHWNSTQAKIDGPEHHREVCRSRRALAEFFDASTRTRFSHMLRSCDES